mgnify:CR=1 FL=1
MKVYTLLNDNELVGIFSSLRLAQEAREDLYIDQMTTIHVSDLKDDWDYQYPTLIETSLRDGRVFEEDLKIAYVLEDMSGKES